MPSIKKLCNKFSFGHLTEQILRLDTLFGIKFSVVVVWGLLNLSSPFAQSLYAPESVFQGEAFTAVIAPASHVNEAEFQLINDSGKIVTTARAFPYEATSRSVRLRLSDQYRCFVTLVGTSPLFKPGNYTLKAVIDTVNGRAFRTRPLVIIDSGYPSETIRLTEAMTRIQNQADPKKKEQAIRFWEAIAKTNMEGVYHYAPLRQPLPDGVGRETSPFGQRRVYVQTTGKRSQSAHYGYDLAEATGTPTLSIGRGKVVLSEERIVTGNTIIIAHLPGIYSVYYHLHDRYVSVGEIVQKGELIGTVGMTGFATGPHIHLELRISTIPVNPVTFFDEPLIDNNLIMAMISR